MSYTIQGELSLPQNYYPQDFLDFYARDNEEIAEKTTSTGFTKALIWQDSPACVTVTFSQKIARFMLDVDCPDPACLTKATKVTTETATTHTSCTPTTSAPFCTSEKALLTQICEHFLGLHQNIEVFENSYKNDIRINQLIKKQTGLRIPQVLPFEAICWAIIGQLISVQAAVSIRRRFIQHFAIKHSSGLFCFPLPEHICNKKIEELRSLGLSQTKAAALIELSTQITHDNIPLSTWQVTTDTFEDIYTTLRSIKGIGPWTISYTLLRGFNWLDGSLHGDVAVRRNIQTLIGQKEKVSVEQAQIWLEQYTPWRALVGAHLWAMQSRGSF